MCIRDRATHGQHNRARKPGSIGACSYPAKVFKGMRMGGPVSYTHLVLKPETINYRTYKPERDGLFCERIFGPIKGCV